MPLRPIAMRLAIRYTAQAREAVGVAAEELDVEGPIGVRELVLRLAERHGPAFRELALDASGSPHPTLLVIVGDELVRSGDGRALRDGDAVTFLTPIAGG